MEILYCFVLPTLEILCDRLRDFYFYLFKYIFWGFFEYLKLEMLYFKDLMFAEEKYDSLKAVNKGKKY